MLITSNLVVERLRQFQRGMITRSALVAWAEHAMQDGDIAPEATEAVARIGLADVTAFALTAADMESLQEKLAAPGTVQRA